MKDPLLVAFAIVALGLLYVVMPVVVEAFLRFRRPRPLRCPQTGSQVRVSLAAGRAGLTSAFGSPRLRVAACSLWPEKQGCEQGCLRSPS